jgi:predicted MPP superfamily phosphohydrolase
VGGRKSDWKDVGFDTLGAVIGAGFALLFYLLIIHVRRKRNILKTTRYFLKTDRKDFRLRIAVASDLHGTGHEKVLRILERERPDLILIPGDLMDDRDLLDPRSRGYEFLRACAAIAPTFYSVGNHEIACYHKGNPWRHPTPIPLTPEIKARIAKTGAVLLDNESVSVGKLTVCGLTSGINGKRNEPNREVLERFSKEGGYRILLCHHPEYFMPYVRKTDIELTLCGHAHGGQWRWFGKGTYAPGQGIFPKYTSGVLENRCVISRGLGNHTMIPRIFNKPELVVIDLE